MSADHHYSRASSSYGGDDDDHKDGVDGSSKGPRQRVHFSCTECHRRKQKCNRQTPCQHCIARKIPERCKTFQPGDDPTDIGTRVARLEKSVSDGFQKIFDLLQNQQRRLSLVSALGSTSADDDKAQQILAETAGSEAGDEVIVGDGTPPAEQYAQAKGSTTMKIDNLLDTFQSGQQGVGHSLISDPTRDITVGSDLDALMVEYGATESVTQSLLSVLPTRQVADALIDHYFEVINWLRQPLSSRIFRAKYEDLWNTGPTLTAENINNYAIIVLVMANAFCSIERPDLIPNDPRLIRLTARRLGYAGRRALLISAILGREDQQQVLAYHLAGRFLLLDRRITEAWTCVANGVKTCHSLGMHRDGTKLHLSEFDTEVRRRIWSFIYYTERVLCMNLGRPTQIDDAVVDTQMPSDANDLDIFPDMFKPAPMMKRPEGKPPSPLSYTKYRHRLATLMGKVIHTYQNLHKHAHYSDIVAIEKELQQHRSTLPTYFRSETTNDGQLHHVNTDWDEGYPFVPIHRYLIESDIDHIRVSLHRPYLLRSNNASGHRYEYSRRSCIDAAHRNIVLRRDIITSLKAKFGGGKVPKAFHLHLGTYKTLNSLVIIGMYLVVTPEAEDAEMLLEHLRYQAEMFKRKSARPDYVRDETQEREANIVNLFLQRIEETRSEATKKKGMKRGDSDSGGPAAKKSKRGMQPPRRQSSSNLSHKSTTSMTTEEDTAGALLDLNQTRKETAPPYHEFVSGWSGGVGGRGHNGSDAHHNKRGSASGDVVAPWPYLPINTHQNSPSAQGSMSGHMLSPANESGSSDSSQNNANIASAQKIFESWFRYNAFDTVDFDTGTMALNPAFQQQQQAQQQQQLNQDGSNKGSMGVSFFGDDGNHSFTTSPSTSVQLSTLPAPVWNTTPAVPMDSKQLQQQQIQQQQGDGNANRPSMMSSNSSGVGGDFVALNTTPSSQSLGSASTAMTSGAPPMMTPSILGPNTDEVNDVSYDPNFWQSLIDKISS